jgi:hypothetical protein
MKSPYDTNHYRYVDGPTPEQEGEALGARHAKMIADCVASTRTTTPAAYPQRGIVCHRCRKVVAATVSSHEIAWASWCMDCWAGRENAAAHGGDGRSLP